jgi:hypothetical protein
MPIRHESDLPEAVAARTSFAVNAIKRRLRTLKDASLIAAGRPAPPLRSLDVARIIMALGAARHNDVARYVSAVGCLPLFSGDGPAMAEAALVDIIEAATWSREPPFDITRGEIVLGQTIPSLSIVSRATDGAPVVIQYRPVETPDLANLVRTSVRVPLNVATAIARDILLRG